MLFVIILSVFLTALSLKAEDPKPFSDIGITKIPTYLYDAGHSKEKGATEQFKKGLLWAQDHILPNLKKLTFQDIQQLHKALNEGAADFGHNGMETVVAGEWRKEHIIVERKVFDVDDRKKLGDKIWVKHGFWLPQDLKVAQAVWKNSPDEESLLETIIRLNKQKKYLNALEVFKKIMFFTDLHDLKDIKYLPKQGKSLQVVLEKKVKLFLQILCKKLKNNEDPIKVAAFAHQELVTIHPFADGNGRTARCLMNFVLMAGGYLPVIFTGKEDAYFDACSRAQNGIDPQAFYNFLREQVIQTQAVKIVQQEKIKTKIKKSSSRKKSAKKRKRSESVEKEKARKASKAKIKKASKKSIPVSTRKLRSSSYKQKLRKRKIK